MDFYPKEIVLTHINSSFHPETFASPSDAVRTFATFVSRLPLNGGVIYYNGDCEVQSSIAGFCMGRRISYGFGKDCQVRGIEVIRHRMGSSFQIEFDGQNQAGEFFTPFPGEWNEKNAIAVIAVALHHGVPVHEIQVAIARFSGISRRYDVLCDRADSSTIIEHLTFQPPVVRDLISETRHRYPEKRCVVIFNSYDVLVLQRQKADYASAFRNADHVIIRPVQPAFQQSTEMASLFDLSGLADQIRLRSKTTVEISSNLEADAIQLARAEITISRQTAFLVIGPPGRQLAENFAREVTES